MKLGLEYNWNTIGISAKGLIRAISELLVLKEKQVQMWDDRKYQLVIPGCPTRARKVSFGYPGITSEYYLLSHI